MIAVVEPVKVGGAIRRSADRHEVRRVLVTGDATLSWNIARVARDPDPSWVWDPADKAEIAPQSTGAILLGQLIRAAGKRQETGLTLQVMGDEEFRLPRRHNDDYYHHAFVLWARGLRRKGGGGKEIWRIEDFIGIRQSDKGKLVAGTSDPAGFEPHLVVVADTDLGFRSNEERWPRVLREDPANRPPVLHCMMPPAFRGPLWDRLIKKPESLVVVVALESLRKSHAAIAYGRSWEQIATEVMRAARTNPELQPLTMCRHVVVTAKTGGAILLSNTLRGPGSTECRIIFDPDTIEGRWEEAYDGQVIGYSTCMTASLAIEMLKDAGFNTDGEVAPVASLIRGVRNGLAAARELLVGGFDDSEAIDLSSQPRADRAGVAFPLKRIACVLAVGHGVTFDPTPESPTAQSLDSYMREARNHDDFSVAQMDVTAKDDWTILESYYREGLEAVAEAVARLGVEVALRGVPVGRFGGYTTVHRGEIEDLRGVDALLRDYARQQVEVPLSIAVFGPPGAGKSFAVGEVGRSAFGDRPFELLTFNLSQMHDAGDLSHAFHLIRDVALHGRLPFVLWDEFDVGDGTAEYVWLRQFLAPMQDGLFQERDVLRPIGQAVFVFAGSDSASLAEFAGKMKGHKAEKGPDFLSRIKGHVDVVGPNPSSETDYYFPIRRAVLLRSVLLRDRPHLFAPWDEPGRPEKVRRLEIDSGVLRALLGVGGDGYRHGARSLETIIRISSLVNRTRFERAALPQLQQLDAHVDAESFMKMVAPYIPAAQELGRLGKGVQAVRNDRQAAARNATRPRRSPHSPVPEFDGPETDRNNEFEDREYDRLPAYLREQNLAIARALPAKLARLGYALRTTGPADTLELHDLLENPRLIDFLRAEHESWFLREQHNRLLNPNQPPKPHFMQWDDLPDDEKALDRSLISEVPQIVAFAHMGIDRATV